MNLTVISGIFDTQCFKKPYVKMTGNDQEVEITLILAAETTLA